MDLTGKQGLAIIDGKRVEGKIILDKNDKIIIMTIYDEFITFDKSELVNYWTRVIAVDFDNTISNGYYPDIGKPNEKVVEAMRREKASGSIIIIWTCREGKPLEEAVRYCKMFDIPFDYVNEFPKFETRKVIADAYWDDKAVNVKDVR